MEYKWNVLKKYLNTLLRKVVRHSRRVVDKKVFVAVFRYFLVSQKYRYTILKVQYCTSIAINNNS